MSRIIGFLLDRLIAFAEQVDWTRDDGMSARNASEYLKIEHVCKTFGKGENRSEVLRDISMDVSRANTSPSSGTRVAASRRC